MELTMIKICNNAFVIDIFVYNNRLINLKPQRKRDTVYKYNSMLHEDHVFEIYRHKILSSKRLDGISEKAAIAAMRQESIHLSSKYDITARTIRDIWTRRTWAYITFQLWQYEDDVRNLSTIPKSSRVPVSTNSFHVKYLEINKYSSKMYAWSSSIWR